MKANAWFVGNDMMVQLTGLRSSTAGSTNYLNSSTNLSCHIWKTSTASTANRLTTAAVNVPYTTGSSAGANGVYQLAFQSTGTVGSAITTTMYGFAQLILNHSGLNGEWRPQWLGAYRGAT